MGQTIFTTQTPASTSNDANSPRVLGLDLKADVGGTIDAIRYYVVGPSISATYTGELWDPSVSTATPLGQASASGPGSAGWLSIPLSTPITITAGHVYSASVWMSLAPGSLQPDYGFTGGGLGADVVNGHLTGLAHTGRFLNNSGTAVYPSGGSGDFNFFIDVDFVAGGATQPGRWGIHL